MARTSGRAGSADSPETFARAAFAHEATGFTYHISRDNAGRYMLEFQKAVDHELSGRKELVWYIGSGAAARSYALQTDGFLYEAPVAYYTQSGKWDFAPAYGRYAYPYLTRPIAPGCLTCHASFLNAVPGTQNRFGTPPFAEGGVACERCHGPGEQHIAKMKSGNRTGGAVIVNPAKLEADRRDSICAQCHLSGEVRVMRPGANWQSYHPGDRLADSVTVFVSAANRPGMSVTGHVEKLAQSACKRASGDRLWCGSCHDPHSVPKPAEAAAWFRSKCQGCHPADACAETPAARARRGNDCAGCHMPRSPVTDAQHVVYTDHSIPRRPRREAMSPSGGEWIPFGGAAASQRNIALAYAIAGSGSRDTAARNRIIHLLETAARQSRDDTEVLVYLAEAYRNSGQGERTIPLFRHSIELDPAQVTAPVGLGSILFERGEYREAIRLWQDALAKNPGLVLVGTSTAMAQWRTGDVRSAEATLRRVIDLSPGFPTARELMKRLQTGWPAR